MDSKALLQLQINQHANEVTPHETKAVDLQATLRAVYLNMQWRVENVRSGVGIFSGLVECQRFPKTFQFMLKYLEVPTVSLMTTNFHRLGMRVALVRVAYNNARPILMTRKTTENHAKPASKLDLFTVDFPQGLEQTCCFHFQIYIEGLLDIYPFQQYDQLLDDHLCASIHSCYWTDFKFFIGDNVFNVHKFIIGARSLRLAAELKHVDSIRLSDDLDSGTFDCFLKFLYTGRLKLDNFKTGVVEQLLLLADTYEVETLKQLCSADMDELKCDNILERFMSTGPPVIKPSLSSLSSLVHEPRCETDSKPDGAEFRFTWDIDQIPEAGQNLMKSVVFRNDNIFHISFRSASSEEVNRNHAFFIFCKQWPEGGLHVIEIFANIFSTANGMRNKRFYANKWEKIAGLNPAMVIFSIDLQECQIQAPFSTLFQIDVTCKGVGKYLYAPKDASVADHLWSASVNGRLTDVDLIVDGRTFRVHKALVAARSPVLRNRFHCDVNRSNRIVLEDVEACIFEEVLYFIYTGFLRVPANEPKLFAAANMYQIETLKFLCQNQVESLDRSLQDLCSFIQLVTS